jgi:hypothetical protein
LYSGGSNVSSRGDLQVDEFEIVQARFPCRSPDMHFFGYRFRIGLKGEYAFAGYLLGRFRLGKFCRTTPITSEHSQIVTV